MKKILYLPIETTARELDAKLLLAHQALLRDYMVIIGREIIKKVAEKLKLGIFFFKDHKKKNFPLKKNINLLIKVALDEEGLVFPNNKSFIRRSRADSCEHLNIIFTWGKFQKKILINHNKDLSQKTFVSGNPRFDLLRSNYRKIYEPISKNLKKNWGKYFLINTNFVTANPSSLYKINQLKVLENFGYKLSKEDFDEHVKKKKFYNRLFKYYKKMIYELAEEFPDINFILRPHPSEDHFIWKKIFKENSNVIVIYQGSAIDWIYGSQGVIHTGCTTGIEAWALNKPVVRYNPEPDNNFEAELPNKFGYKCITIKDLKILIKQILIGNKKGTFQKQKNLAKPFIENISGQFSIIRILDVIDKYLLLNKTPIIEKISLKDIKIARLDNMIERIKYLLINLFKKTNLIEISIFRKTFQPLISQTFQKFSSINKNYIKLRFKQYDKLSETSISKLLSIKKISSDSFFLRKKKKS